MEGISPGLNCMWKQALGRAKQYFASALQDGAIGLPFTQKAACGERGDIRRAGQLLI